MKTIRYILGSKISGVDYESLKNSSPGEVRSIAKNIVTIYHEGSINIL